MSPLLLGHRGARGFRSVRENTFAAFDLAIEHGCDGFEFDVRLTADGVGVICHNTRFRRVTVSKAKTSQLPDLPRLEALLERYGRRAFLDIELKVPGSERRLLELLSRHPATRGFVVSSFLPDVLLELRWLDASVPLGLICRDGRQLRRWRKMPVEYVIPHQSVASRKLVNEVHAAGKKLFVWTVNRKSVMLRLAEWGVDGLISDRTALLAQTLKHNPDN
ncbi:MAG TPA: glycerophosphodiester phosphodiesterase [Terriglobales bacterium]|nr:glycerophosphodiester phosphodiesterase [Terriglobales bacterium]